MDNEQLSHQLDPQRTNEVLMHLLIASVCDNRTLVKILLQVLSNDDKSQYNDLIKQSLRVQAEEYESLKKHLYARYGWLPPGLFDGLTDEG